MQGITRAVKDPQREKNKSKSQNLHILNTQANSGWVCDDDALSPEGFKDLENVGSKPGLVVRKRPGKEIREIVPKGRMLGIFSVSSRQTRSSSRSAQLILT